MSAEKINVSELYDALRSVVETIRKEIREDNNPWVDTDEAMGILKIKSKTTLQELRDEREIVFSQPRKKHILYNRTSILAYIEKHKSKTFDEK